jgi:hypothetical protein
MWYKRTGGTCDFRLKQLKKKLNTNTLEIWAAARTKTLKTVNQTYMLKLTDDLILI